MKKLFTLFNIKLNNLHTSITFPHNDFLNHISLDCVVFGFNNNELKVLLLKLTPTKEYCLPGGFLKKEETLESAATRVLQERTGLDDVFLRQFKVFSDPERSKTNTAMEELIATAGDACLDFFRKRFITIGFYALVDFTQVDPTPDYFSDSCEWHSIDEDIPYLLDHKTIINEALEQLRHKINNQPIGYNLLPQKFTMPELQKLYETILGRNLDRRNFQRKILSYKILNKLEERKTGGAYKSPYLYEFDLEKYQSALDKGLSGSW